MTPGIRPLIPAVLLAVPLGLRLADIRIWPLALLHHFPLQLALLAGLTALVILLSRRPRAAAATLMIAAGHLIVWLSSPGTHPPSAITTAQAHAPVDLRVVTHNVLYKTTPDERTLDWLAGTNADLIGLVEVTEPWHRALSVFDDAFPHRHDVRRMHTSSNGLTLLSRHPLDNARGVRLPGTPLHLLRAGVDAPGGAAEVLLVHPPSPRHKLNQELRDRVIREIARMIAATPGRWIVLGDFNLTPYSPVMSDFLSKTGLTLGPPTASWPAAAGPLGIPIDHILARGYLIRARTSGPKLTSDHRPVAVDLATPQD